MTHHISSTEDQVLVAIDIAKIRNDVLVEQPDGKRKAFKMANKMTDFVEFTRYLKAFGFPCLIGFEATGNYHRPLAYYLLQQGFELRLVSSLAAARTRQALYNSWDKNDPKDAQVILHMLKTGLTQIYYDPLVQEINDIQELSLTHYQISRHKVRIQHSIMTHYLPLYFPEAQRFFHASRAEWLTAMLIRFPVIAAITKYTCEQFIEEAWVVAGKKVSKSAVLSEFYEAARTSIGLPVAEDSMAAQMFRVILGEHQVLCRLRADTERQADAFLQGEPDYHRFRTIPGIGPIIALTILAEAGDLRRFAHYRQFLKFCGFDLATQQSGRFRGTSKLSKHGNARLRYVFWLAANVAIRLRENTFRTKYERYIKRDPDNKDLKRKAYTAVATKMARVVHAVIKNGTDYRCYYESEIPSGRIPSQGPLRQLTS